MKNALRYGTVAILVAMAAIGAAGSAGASPALGENCVACHSDPSMLSEGHLPTEGMTNEMCAACHSLDSSRNSCVTNMDMSCLLPASGAVVLPRLTAIAGASGHMRTD